MRRRTLVGTMAGLAVIGGLEAMARELSTTSRAGVGYSWTGAAALRGGKGYAECHLGQLHYRSMGRGGGVPFLLLHQTPFGLTEYVDIQPALARAGRRSIASDNPGYGLSDPPPESVTVMDLAQNLVGLLDHLGIEKAIVAGHHTGAAIAAAFAARHRDRTAGVLLHGCPLYTASERAERLARSPVEVALKADGSHFSDNFQRIYANAGPVPANLASATWAILGLFMGGAHTPTYTAIFSNDMAPDLAAIRAPTLVLSDTNDSLHDNDRKAASLRPDFAFQLFSNGRSFALMQEPERWANTLVTFAKTHNL